MSTDIVMMLMSTDIVMMYNLPVLSCRLLVLMSTHFDMMNSFLC